MKELYGDIWSLAQPGDVLCITTNEVLRSNGAGVMGAGIAKEARDRYPEIEWALGNLIRAGQRVGILHYPVNHTDYYLVSFTTKHHYRDRSSLTLINNSIQDLLALMNGTGISRALLPRPGCGLGGLNWSEVKKVIERALQGRDDIVIVSK